ncbi:hypothetical protein D3C72_1860950 [compost metagenome]
MGGLQNRDSLAARPGQAQRAVQHRPQVHQQIPQHDAQERERQQVNPVRIGDAVAHETRHQCPHQDGGRRPARHGGRCLPQLPHIGGQVAGGNDARCPRLQELPERGLAGPAFGGGLAQRVQHFLCDDLTPRGIRQGVACGGGFHGVDKNDVANGVSFHGPIVASGKPARFSPLRCGINDG